jgi:hypothetical protein
MATKKKVKASFPDKMFVREEHFSKREHGTWYISDNTLEGLAGNNGDLVGVYVLESVKTL